MTTYVNDTFSDTNGTALSAHAGETGASWTLLSAPSGSPALQIQGNKLQQVGTATVFALYRASGTPASSDYGCLINMVVSAALPASCSWGPGVRFASAAVTGYFALYDPNGSAWQIYRANAGAFETVGGTYSQALSVATYAVKLSAEGTGATVTLALNIDGTDRLVVTDTSASRITSTGFAGFWWSQSAASTAMQFDSVVADDAAGGAALSSGSATVTALSNTTISLSCGAASGGTAPITYQWHRSTSAAFTPGGGTLISGATSLTLADSTGLSQDTAYFYICRATDAAAATEDSVAVAGFLKSAPVKIGFIGDSITYGYGLSAGQSPPDQVRAVFQKWPLVRDVTIVNSGVNSSKSSDWTADSSGTNLFVAKAAFASAGVTHVHIMLGANDAGTATHVSAATYGANLSTICTNLVTAGYKVILSYPTYIVAGANGGASDVVSVDLAISYRAQIDSLINNRTILRGDRESWKYFTTAQNEYQADLVHPTAVGAASLGGIWASAIAKALRLGVTQQTVAVNLVNSSNAAQASLTGIKWAWFDTATPDIFDHPSDSGAVETTDGSGVLSIPVWTALTSGQVGWLVVTDSDGTTAMVHKAFSGPVEVS